MRAVLIIVVTWGLVSELGAPTVASAQPSASDREAAADAYDQGTRLFMRQSFAEAARMFETADRLAPAAPALAEAVRAHLRAGNDLRAATLALRLAERHPDDEEAQAAAAPVLEAAGERFLKVTVQCDGCAVDLDGTLAGWPSFFLEPGVEHRVTGSFETGDRTETVSGEAGEERTLSFEAPPAPAGQTPVTPPRGGDRVEEGGGLSPVVPIIGAGLTAVAAGVLVWSGLDTLAGVDEYERVRSQELLDEGQGKELRTNVLIGVTAGLGAITLVLAILTDWGGSGEREPVAATVSPMLSPIQGGAAASVQGAF